MPKDIFVSEVSPDNQMGGVFEYDGETSYFYLYRMPAHDDDGAVLEFIHITSKTLNFNNDDVNIVWSRTGKFVGLFIFGKLWAAFGLSGEKYGGEYKLGGAPNIPDEVLVHFPRLA